MKEVGVYNIQIISHVLSAGADQTQAELRIPSIRGQLRWWHRAIYCNPAKEKVLFGGIGQKNDTGIASKLVLRLKNEKIISERQTVLPHKSQGAGSRQGLKGEFTLSAYLRNCGSLGEFNRLKKEVDDLIRVWILLGSIGARVSRAAGSIFCKDELSLETFQNHLREMARPKDLSLYLSEEEKTVSELRRIASDTVNNGEFLGYVRSKPSSRLASPLKMKIVKINQKYHLLVFSIEAGKAKGGMELLQRSGKLKGLSFKQII